MHPGPAWVWLEARHMCKRSYAYMLYRPSKALIRGIHGAMMRSRPVCMALDMHTITEGTDC